MPKRLEIYKCLACSNQVEVFIAGGGELVCCGKPMILLSENTQDAAQEKHVPVVEKIPGGFKVTVGSVAHPMLPEHYIEWIEIIDGDRVYRQDLHPGQKPEAIFMMDAENVTARESCNLHGLWKK